MSETLKPSPRSRERLPTLPAFACGHADRRGAPSFFLGTGGRGPRSVLFGAGWAANRMRFWRRPDPQLAGSCSLVRYKTLSRELVERRRAEEEALRLAERPLTGACNRRSFLKAVTTSPVTASGADARSRSGYRYDHFKNINDYTAQSGATQCCSQAPRAARDPARQCAAGAAGGDEFASQLTYSREHVASKTGEPGRQRRQPIEVKTPVGSARDRRAAAPFRGPMPGRPGSAYETRRRCYYQPKSRAETACMVRACMDTNSAYAGSSKRSRRGRATMIDPLRAQIDLEPRIWLRNVGAGQSPDLGLGARINPRGREMG